MKINFDKKIEPEPQLYNNAGYQAFKDILSYFEDDNDLPMSILMDLGKYDDEILNENHSDIKTKRNNLYLNEIKKLFYKEIENINDNHRVLNQDIIVILEALDEAINDDNLKCKCKKIINYFKKYNN